MLEIELSANIRIPNSKSQDEFTDDFLKFLVQKGYAGSNIVIKHSENEERQ